MSGMSTRKTFIGSLIVLPALAGIATSTASADTAKSSQASMHYQATPNNGQQCSKCNFFIAGSSASDNGSCKIVDGSISPNGWCIAFNAKS